MIFIPGLEPGTWLLVRYKGPEDVWHERVVLGFVTETTYLVIMLEATYTRRLDHDPESETIQAVRLTLGGVLPLDLV